MLRNYHGWFVQHNELYELLGLNPKRHLPDEGFEKTIRVGRRVVTYRCEPATAESKGHRVKFLCDCGRWIPFGRAGQHLRVCADYRRTEFNIHAA